MWKWYRECAIAIVSGKRYFARVIVGTLNNKIFDQSIDASINIFCQQILEYGRSNLCGLKISNDLNLMCIKLLQFTEKITNCRKIIIQKRIAH